MKKRLIIFGLIIVLLLLFSGLNSMTSIGDGSRIVDIVSAENGLGPPTVKINLDPSSTVYEGEIINCSISGDPIFKYWSINNQSQHITFYGDDPIIFDPEPTPLDIDYVTLTVYTENAFGDASDSVQVVVKRIYFGDIHWHSIRSDGKFPLKTMYKNAKKDNYLDSNDISLINISVVVVMLVITLTHLADGIFVKLSGVYHLSLQVSIPSKL